LSDPSEREVGFDEAYSGVPPWDIGRPQREIVKLEEKGELGARILDIGCGTGENSFYLAEKGHEAVGLDFSARAIELARSKAKSKSDPSKVNFFVADALHADVSSFGGRGFDSIIDCGLFHSFDDQERLIYVGKLKNLLNDGGRYFVLCFSDKEPGNWGPRRISENEIRESFSKGWQINYIRDAIFENNDPKLFSPGGAKAWLSSISRIDA
jgi:cyclopropane fatty-acyl-phospholipid synthase-like methyltransferase